MQTRATVTTGMTRTRCVGTMTTCQRPARLTKPLQLPSLRRAVPDARTPSRPSAPRFPGPTPPRTPSRKPATKTPSAARGSDSPSEPRLSTADRSRLPLELIRELDRAVFRQVWNGLRIVKGGESEGKGLPDGIEVVWNARLRNTAGRASCKT